MGAPLKSVTQMRGHINQKQRAERTAIEKTLFTYQELVDQPPCGLMTML